MNTKSKLAVLLVAGLWLTGCEPLAHAGTAGVITGSVTAKKKKYLKNAVVYLERVPGDHKAPAKPARMDQIKQTFVPFVLPVVKGTKVEFLNSDDTGHNVFSPDGEKYDLGTFPKGETRAHAFTKEGVYTQLCKMHASMIAYVVVLQNPHFAVTGDDGSFRIPSVPPGSYELRVWHERLRADPLPVIVAAGAEASVTFPLGR